MKTLLSIQAAADKCRIPWSQAWGYVLDGTWTPVRNGPGNHCIRVRESEVTAKAQELQQKNAERRRKHGRNRKATA